LHRKPLGVLNVNGYYDALGAFLGVAVEQRFLRAQQREALIFDGDPEALLTRLAGAEPQHFSKWLSEVET
jgi:predicted Rossmann-fold nucleotide-binding protein